MKTNSLHDLLFSRTSKNGQFYTLAIDGRGGSGKTAFGEYLKELLPGFVFLNGDDYFEPVENQIAWGEFNDERFKQDVIEPLKTGNSFMYGPYDWHTENHISTKRITVEKGLVLERCFSFAMDFDWDLKIWVETPRELCLQREITRAHMPKDRVLAAAEGVWQPQEDEYIKKTQPVKHADIIIDGNKSFTSQLIT